MSDRRPLSRRKLLLAVATTGVAASTGSGAAAMFHDSETTTSAVTAGTLDLELGPWTSDSAGPSPFENSNSTVSSGDSGRERRELSISDNPGYLWFRTACACDPVTPVEEALFLRFGVDEGGDGTVDRWLTDEDLSLRESRERFGDGVSIGEIPTTTTWQFVVDWVVEENIADETTVEFDFVFYATQSRHVMNADSVAPDWECDCDGTGGGEGGGDESLPGISWVAFCASEPYSKNDLEFSRSEDERTLTLTSVPDVVDTIALKYGPYLDLFTDLTESTFTVGTGGMYEKQGTQYPGTDPTRSNGVPCPESYGCKYEFEDETWECKDNLAGDGASGNNGVVNSPGGHPSLRPVVHSTGGED